MSVWKGSDHQSQASGNRQPDACWSLKGWGGGEGAIPQAGTLQQRYWRVQRLVFAALEAYGLEGLAQIRAQSGESAFAGVVFDESQVAQIERHVAGLLGDQYDILAQGVGEPDFIKHIGVPTRAVGDQGTRVANSAPDVVHHGVAREHIVSARTSAAEGLAQRAQLIAPDRLEFDLETHQHKNFGGVASLAAGAEQGPDDFSVGPKGCAGTEAKPESPVDLVPLRSEFVVALVVQPDQPDLFKLGQMPGRLVAGWDGRRVRHSGAGRCPAAGCNAEAARQAAGVRAALVADRLKDANAGHFHAHGLASLRCLRPRIAYLAAGCRFCASHSMAVMA